MISYQFNLEVTPGSMPPILHMAQYDTGRTFIANLKNNGVAFTPTQGSEAKIKGRNAAGVCWEQEATVSGSTVTFTPEGAATDQFGIMPVQLEILKGEDILSTLLILFDVQRAGYTNEEAAVSPEFRTAMEEAAQEAVDQAIIDAGAGSGGQPVPVETAAGMTDTDKIYLYLGNESGMEYGYVYVYLNGAWTKTTIYGRMTATDSQVANAVGDWLDENITNPDSPPVDTSLTVRGAAADASVVGAILNGADDALIPVDLGSWLLKSTINSSGTRVINQDAAKTGALNENYFYTVDPNRKTFKYTGAVKDSDNNYFIVYLHEYSATQTWLRRTCIASGDVTPFEKTVGSDCVSMCITFSRASGTGIAMTDADIATYFQISCLVDYSEGLVYRVNQLEGNDEYVAGGTYYFSVPVNQVFPNDTSTSGDVQDSETFANVQCVVKLPSTYTKNGTPTKLIMCAHGTSGWVSGSAYNAQLDRWSGLLSAGYACYDVNGGMPFDSENAHEAGQNMGGPRAIEAYFKAYQWIVRNMNIEPLLYVSGLSMGGLAALNFANRYPEVVRCIGICYPVTALYNQAWLHPWYTGTGTGSTKGCIAREYNFDSPSTWEAANVVGFNPETNKRLTVGTVDYCFLAAPIKIWHGDADQTVDYTYSVALINAVKAAGGVGEMRIVHGAGHGESTFSEWTTLFNAELKAFFDRY